MKTIYFLAAIYFIIALFHAVNLGKANLSAWDRTKNFFASAVFPGWWAYVALKSIVKKLIHKS